MTKIQFFDDTGKFKLSNSDFAMNTGTNLEKACYQRVSPLIFLGSFSSLGRGRSLAIFSIIRDGILYGGPRGSDSTFRWVLSVFRLSLDQRG